MFIKVGFMRKIKYIFFLISLLLCCNSSFSGELNLGASINKLVDHYLPKAFVGIVVSDINGKTYYSKNASKLFLPGSNMKLFTCTAALLKLGPDYQYSTVVKANLTKLKNNTLNGNLYIRFAGDPSFTVGDLKRLVLQIKQAGIRKINGNVVIDNTIFKGDVYPVGMTYEDLNAGYAAPATAIVLNQNKFEVEVHLNKGSREPIAKMNSPYPDYMHLINKIKKGKKNDVAWRVEKNNILLTGTLKSGVHEMIGFAIRSPKKFASQILRNALKKNRIYLQGNIITGRTPYGLKAIAIHRSQKISELIRETLKYSNNLYAQCIFKTLGEKLFGDNTYKASIEVLKRKISELTRIKSQNYAIYDGAGLSRYNLVSPNQIIKLLRAIYHNMGLKRVMLSSLPISGFDGTLEKRMTSPDLKGRIRAKTGTLNGTSALSGFLFLPSGNPIIFSIMTNNELSRQSLKDEKTFEDKLCPLLVKYFDACGHGNF